MHVMLSHPDLNVGEPVSGKEVIARTIHSMGANNLMPFRVRNCTNVRAIDLERELLGSTERRDALSNTYGTLFLDQVVDLSVELQGILLRAIQRSESVASSNCVFQPRIIAAATRDLRLAVIEGP